MSSPALSTSTHGFVKGKPVCDVSSAVWKKGSKTKGLRAKPISSLLVDRTAAAKFLVDTLEAKEQVAPNAMFCMGAAGDAWQQTPQKLLAKYDVVDVDENGWLVCQPKPGNVVEFFEADKEGYIIGQWGAEINGVKNLQEFSPRDMIVRNTEDHSDVWVVRRKIWDNTYEEVTK